jgi:hypothetical protein
LHPQGTQNFTPICFSSLQHPTLRRVHDTALQRSILISKLDHDQLLAKQTKTTTNGQFLIAVARQAATQPPEIHRRRCRRHDIYRFICKSANPLSIHGTSATDIDVSSSRASSSE